MSAPDNFSHEDFKTRVLVYSTSSSHSQLIQQILDFNNRIVDWHGADTIRLESDFLVFQTSNAEEVVAFKPTIVLISSEFSSEKLELVFNCITPGGIMIYPEGIESIALNSNVYSRKLPYSSPEVNQTGDVKFLVTNLGDLSVAELDASVLADLEGIKLFCAQFGVMEEDFFEALAELSLK